MPFKDHHKVNVIEQKASDSRQSSSLSSIVRQVRSLGLSVEGEVGVEGDLIGSRIIGSVRLLGEEYPALIDSRGSGKRNGPGIRSGCLAFGAD